MKSSSQGMESQYFITQHYITRYRINKVRKNDMFKSKKRAKILKIVKEMDIERHNIITYFGYNKKNHSCKFS